MAAKAEDREQADGVLVGRRLDHGAHRGLPVRGHCVSEAGIAPGKQAALHWGARACRMTASTSSEQLKSWPSRYECSRAFRPRKSDSLGSWNSKSTCTSPPSLPDALGSREASLSLTPLDVSDVSGSCGSAVALSRALFLIPAESRWLAQRLPSEFTGRR